MQATKKLTWGAVVIVLIILIYSMVTQGTVDYASSITEHRAEIHDFMINSAQSPLPDSIKSSFSGMDYYDVNQEFKVTAELEHLTSLETLTLGTSDGTTQNYSKFAFANFNLKGKELRLLVLKSEDEQGKDYFFIPFSDLTSAEETYGGGRYLELAFTKKKRLVIDFNLAFNPYCAYNPSYSCPLPPAENHLQVPVRAGERNFPL